MCVRRKKKERDLDENDDVDAVRIEQGKNEKLERETGKMEREKGERKGVISCPTFDLKREYI